MALWFLTYLAGIKTNEKEKTITTLRQNNSYSSKGLKSDILQLIAPILYSQ